MSFSRSNDADAILCFCATVLRTLLAPGLGTAHRRRPLCQPLIVNKSTRLVGIVATTMVLVSCGTETPSPAAAPTPVDPDVSMVLECDNRMHETGTPDYGIGPDTARETAKPLELAARYVEDWKVEKYFPGVEPVLADAEPPEHVVALVADGKTVELLRYEDHELLGWHLTGIENCVPNKRR